MHPAVGFREAEGEHGSAGRMPPVWTRLQNFISRCLITNSHFYHLARPKGTSSARRSSLKLRVLWKILVQKLIIFFSRRNRRYHARFIRENDPEDLSNYVRRALRGNSLLVRNHFRGCDHYAGDFVILNPMNVKTPK